MTTNNDNNGTMALDTEPAVTPKRKRRETGTSWISGVDAASGRLDLTAKIGFFPADAQLSKSTAKTIQGAYVICDILCRDGDKVVAFKLNGHPARFVGRIEAVLPKVSGPVAAPDNIPDIGAMA